MNRKQIALTITALLSFSGITSAEYVIQFNNSQSKGMIPTASSQEFYSSCKDILDNGESTGDGVYSITVNNKEFDVYCDMTSAGGGWTMVVAQFEQDPVTNWNEGIQADYDPSLYSGKGFALSSQEIPSHTQTAFGKSLDADFVNYFNYLYQTGTIEEFDVTGLKDNSGYKIDRDALSHHTYHDPELSYTTNTSSFFYHYHDTLTVDKNGGSYYNWAFSPRKTEEGEASYAGYSMNGVRVTSSLENYAWTVWVR